MTFEILAEMVANDFLKTMDEEEFDTFKEMADCYWWTPKDIKEEVDSIIHSVCESAGEYGTIDEIDGNDVFLNDELISYRKFSGMWRSILKNKGRYDD